MGAGGPEPVFLGYFGFALILGKEATLSSLYCLASLVPTYLPRLLVLVKDSGLARVVEGCIALLHRNGECHLRLCLVGGPITVVWMKLGLADGFGRVQDPDG